MKPEVRGLIERHIDCLLEEEKFKTGIRLG